MTWKLYSLAFLFRLFAAWLRYQIMVGGKKMQMPFIWNCSWERVSHKFSHLGPLKTSDKQSHQMNSTKLFLFKAVFFLFPPPRTFTYAVQEYLPSAQHSVRKTKKRNKTKSTTTSVYLCLSSTSLKHVGKPKRFLFNSDKRQPLSLPGLFRW